MKRRRFVQSLVGRRRYQNPTMTILALSMRAGEYIADQFARREL
jgi:hypothetical protein